MSMTDSWLALYPQWYVAERQALARHYPQFNVYAPALDACDLVLFGELEIRPPGGTVRHPVILQYPAAAPFEKPILFPLQSLPEVDPAGRFKAKPALAFFDHRHQMPDGQLCLFQREMRIPGGDIVTGDQCLARAEQWFLGHHTGHWPPDSADSELEAHFACPADVLIGESFFREDIEGQGRFYMVPDLRRAIDSDNDKLTDIHPLIMTMLTRENGLIQVYDARADVSNIFPWIKAESWDPSKIAKLDNETESAQAALRGYWWSLPAEPKPFRDGAGFLAALAPAASNGDVWSLVSTALKGELTVGTRHFLALKYPSRHGGPAWLILMMIREQRKGTPLLQTEHQKRSAFEKCPVYCFRAHSVRPAELRLRNTGVVTEQVSQKTVALIGLGALGSEVAELLAKAGVGAFRLCDSDRLATGNVLRHVGGLNEFGASKTRVVASRLFEINPYLEFNDGSLIQGSAVGSLKRLSEFIAPADLIVSTTADEGVESVINHIALVNHKPVLYGRALRRGSIGRVFLVRPGRDACKACLADFARARSEGQDAPPDWIDVSEPEDLALVHECGRPVIPASAIDLSFIAALIARCALDFLEGKDHDQNHWLWSKSPAMEIDPRLGSAFTTFAASLKPRPACFTCQEPDVTSVVLTDSARASITTITANSPDAETGGVLIGYVDDARRAVALRVTGPGPNAERSEMLFSRDVPYIQAEIERAARELDDRGCYIGEWHSHLEAMPRPSVTDIHSLFGIASAPNYLTRCPVMIIAGFDPVEKKVAGLFAWSFPVSGRMYPVEIDPNPIAVA
jgi:integrative and conjugative element protein (TIGR02256 family)